MSEEVKSVVFESKWNCEQYSTCEGCQRYCYTGGRREDYICVDCEEEDREANSDDDDEE